MRLGIIGWYGHNNAGDERILWCLRNFFSGHELLVCTSWRNALEHIADLNNCDFVLIGGGGLILRNFNSVAPLLESIRTRLGCIGISVEATGPDVEIGLDILREKCEFILVRDRHSRELLSNHFKVIVAPDLTFLYPYKIGDLVDTYRTHWAVNLRPWPWYPGDFRGLFQRSLKKVESKIPFLSRVWFGPKWSPDRTIKEINHSVKNTIPLPMYFEDECENDHSVMENFFEEVPKTFDIARMQQCGFGIGMRLHFLVFATQMGIPFVSLSYQPKNHNYCTEIGLQELSVDIYKSQELSSTIQYVRENATLIKRRLIEYSDEARMRITDCMTKIQELITVGGRL